ncbi:MAG TPA: MerR family transcriptional regulator [Firmicutes bacterium]|nr:MAG: MerR family transcriptional regulator [Candidatus Coatesbacteria bacterium]HEC80121.1 MerR family transcriptional regulator [Bacillota bacterium]HEC80480.1 MerR family transcriptional regulator [Bacillota bacterium]
MRDKLFYSIKEVSQMLDIKDYTLRYWEKEFPQLKPRRSSGGRRMYTLSDIELLKRIKGLLYERGMTIEGVRKSLRKKKIPSTTIAEIKAELEDILRLIESI